MPTKCYADSQRESLPLDDPSRKVYRATSENTVIGPGRLGFTSPSIAPKTRIIKSEVSTNTNKDKLLKAIYLLKDDLGSVRYVGYAKDPDDRLKRHLREYKFGFKTHRKAWVGKMLEEGRSIHMEIVEWTNDWNMVERQWIFKMRALGCDLVNGSDGGEAIPPSCRQAPIRYPAVKRTYRSFESNLRHFYKSNEKYALIYEYYRDCLVPSCRRHKSMDWLESGVEKYGVKFVAQVFYKLLKEEGLSIEELIN